MVKILYEHGSNLVIIFTKIHSDLSNEPKGYYTLLSLLFGKNKFVYSIYKRFCVCSDKICVCFYRSYLVSKSSLPPECSPW